MLKWTGIVRRVDDVGRITLPAEMRRVCEIEEHTPVEIYVDGVQIVLRKYHPFCIFCGQGGQVLTLQGKPVCLRCRASLSQAAGT